MWSLPEPPGFYIKRSYARDQAALLMRDKLGDYYELFSNGDFQPILDDPMILGDILINNAIRTLVRFGILPLKDNMIPENPEKKPVKTPNRPNFTYHEFEVNVYYNVKKYNPVWWNMVGTGEPYNEVCGHVWPGEYKGCLDVGKHALHGQVGKIVLRKVSADCDRLECPVCYPKVVANRAKRIERRFLKMPKWSYEYENRVRQVALMSEDDKKQVDMWAGIKKEPVKTAEERSVYGKPIHLMISPSKKDSEDLKSQEGYERQKKRMLRMAKNAGMDGGCIIFHPWRSDKETTPEIDEVGEFKIINGEFDIEFIKTYMKTFGKEFNAWKTSPHWHIIGYAKDGIDGEKVAKNYRKTRWVIKNLGVRKSVLSTAFYQLTHAGIHKGIKTVTWFGMMAQGRGFVDTDGCKEPDYELPTCPICKQEMKNYVYVGDGLIPLEKEPEGTYIIDWVAGLREVFELKAERKILETDTVESIDASFRYDFMPEKPVVEQGNTILNYV